MVIIAGTHLLQNTEIMPVQAEAAVIQHQILNIVLRDVIIIQGNAKRKPVLQDGHVTPPQPKVIEIQAAHGVL